MLLSLLTRRSARGLVPRATAPWPPPVASFADHFSVRSLTGRLRLASCAALLVGMPLLAQDPPRALPGGPPMSALPLDRIAAVVGTKVILVSDLEAAITAQQMQVPEDSLERMSMLRGVLEQLVDLEVLVQRAEADTALRIDDGEVEALAEEQIRQIRGGFPGDREFRAALTEAGFGTPEEFRRRQVEQIRRDKLAKSYIEKLKRDGKFTTVNVSERDVSAELERRMGELPDRPATLGFQQIVVPTLPGEASRTRARATIDSLFLRLQNRPQDFEEVARAVSQDGAAENGGDLGWNRRGVMVPEFDRVMFMLNPGVVSPPVESRYGWHLIRVDRVQPAEVKARHILIRPEIDSADFAFAMTRADSVRRLWDAGTPFDSLRARFHDERSGEDAIVPEVMQEQLPEAYAAAIGDAGVGTIVGPFEIEDPGSGGRKLVVLRVTRLVPAGKMTLDEARASLRRSMQEAYSIRRLLDTLRRQTYVSVRL
jgi:peptidyl-prolyl cis-trans isomerase SurA